MTLTLSLLVVACLAAGAMAVHSASRIWLRHWAERRLRGAASVVRYLERPQRLLGAAHAGAAIALGLAGASIGWRGADAPARTVVTLSSYALLILVAGQIVPRAIARRWPSALIPLTMPVLQLVEALTAPLLTLGRPRAGSGPPAASAGADAPARDAMEDLLREGELEGVGRREEIAIISGVMTFGEKRARDVMTARADVFAVPQGLPVAEAAARIAESAFSRIPVYRGSLDQVIGMYHAFDVLKERVDRVPPLRPVAYASGDTPCNELLFRMLRARLHLAIVHDERGHTLGIATLENLLEELVGDIRDEHDEPVAVATGPAAA